MSRTENKFYWLRLYDDFFTSKRIKKLRGSASGGDLIVIYLKMQLLSLKTGGTLTYTGLEDCFEKELALDLDEKIDSVQKTLNYLKSCGLIETQDGITWLLPYAVECTGTEGSSSKRVREFRERKKQQMLHCNASVTDETLHETLHETNETKNCNGEKEIEKEIEIEIDKDIEIECEEEMDEATFQALKAQYKQLLYVAPDGSYTLDPLEGIPLTEAEKQDQKDMFDEFWKAYPKKVGKEAAKKAFKKIKPNIDTFNQMLLTISLAKDTDQWKKDKGQFIPYPATWLNQGRWEDDISSYQQSSNGFIDGMDGDALGF